MAVKPIHALFDLAGRTAVITGANGILGRCYVEAFAQSGARIAIVDLDADESHDHACSIAREHGVDCIGIGADIASSEGVAQMASRVADQLGGCDILLNNAASKGASLEEFFAPTERYSIETWRDIMSVNLDGMFLVTQALAPHMVAAGKGAIINVSSIYGNVGPDQRIYEGSEYLGRPINTPAVYAASKAGVLGLTRYLATLWGAAGVRVNAITPGGVESGQNDTFMRRYADRTPLRRMARREEMVGAVLYLASDASSYVTGHNLVVDGGWSIW
jgi:NAD(P)-dependent dehydrogenase (short-subunit alcohol dehydrogenase family)